MPDFSAKDLLRLLTSDEPLQDWIADSVNLPPAALDIAPSDPWERELPSDLPWLTLISRTEAGCCTIHLVIGAPDELTAHTGPNALRRAAFLHEARCPIDHSDFRVALLTIGDAGSAGQNFPYVISGEDLSLRLSKVIAA